jgi:hypothetical protein
MYSYDVFDYLRDPTTGLEAINGFLYAANALLPPSDLQFNFFARSLVPGSDLLESVRNVVLRPYLDYEEDLTYFQLEVHGVHNFGSKWFEVAVSRLEEIFGWVGKPEQGRWVVGGLVELIQLQNPVEGMAEVVTENKGYLLGKPGFEILIFRNGAPPLMVHFGTNL